MRKYVVYKVSAKARSASRSKDIHVAKASDPRIRLEWIDVQPADRDQGRAIRDSEESLARLVKPVDA